MTKLSRKLQTQKRHRRLRRFLIGDSTRPRLSVFRSNNHIYAQVIDDSAQKTICSASTVDKALINKKCPNAPTTHKAPSQNQSLPFGGSK